MTIYAPWVLDENDTVPYVTIQDIKYSAIAASLDFTNLVPNTSVNAQDAALAQLIPIWGHSIVVKSTTLSMVAVPGTPETGEGSVVE